LEITCNVGGITQLSRLISRFGEKITLILLATLYGALMPRAAVDLCGFHFAKRFDFQSKQATETTRKSFRFLHLFAVSIDLALYCLGLNQFLC